MANSFTSISFLIAFYRFTKKNAVRSAMLKAMVNSKTDSILKNAKIDLSKMPPCISSLRPHLKRGNYRAAQWELSHEAHSEMPSPTNHGWLINEETGIIEPRWCDDELVPQRLIDLLADENDNHQATYASSLSESDSDSESDYNKNELSDDSDFNDDDFI